MNNSQEKPTPGEPPRHHGRRGLFHRLKHGGPSRGWPTGGGTSAIGSSIGGTRLPAALIPVTGITAAPNQAACRGPGGVCGISSRSSWPVHLAQQDALAFARLVVSAHKRARIPITATTAAAGAAGLPLAWRRVRRRLRHSAFGRRCVAIYERLYEWWYPVLDDPYPYSGYYGRRRKSRPVVLWRRFKRWVRNSWLGERYREVLYRFDDWWYPPSSPATRHYPQLSRHRRVSRPVLAYRRWRRWFRKTWVGREFGWIAGRGRLPAGFPSGRSERKPLPSAGCRDSCRKSRTLLPWRFCGSGGGGRVQLWQAALPPLCGDSRYARQAEQIHVERRFRPGLLARAAGDGHQPGQRGRLPRQRRAGGLGQFAVRAVLAAAHGAARAHCDQPPGPGFDRAQGRDIPLFDRGQDAR